MIPNRGIKSSVDLASLLKQRRREEGKKQIADAAKPRFDLDVKHAAEKFATTFNFYIWAQCQKKKKKRCVGKNTRAMQCVWLMRLLVVSGRKKKLPPL